jgi:hypothetical protein
MDPYILQYVVLLVANIYFYIVSMNILIKLAVKIMMRKCKNMKCKQYKDLKMGLDVAWIMCNFQQTWLQCWGVFMLLPLLSCSFYALTLMYTVWTSFTVASDYLTWKLGWFFLCAGLSIAPCYVVCATT